MNARPRLDALYADLHDAGRRALVLGRTRIDPLPVDGGERWGVSAVLRPSGWSPALSRCRDELARLLGRRHAVYGPDALHVTLRQFENHRVAIVAGDDGLRAHADALAAVAARWSPVTIALRGLAASPAGIVVQGWPDADLGALRHALHDRLVAGGRAPEGPEAERTALRETAHASLAIYGRRPREPIALAAFVDGHRATDFGRYRFDSVALVGYRRSRDAVSLVDYGAFAFGAVA